MSHHAGRDAKAMTPSQRLVAPKLPASQANPWRFSVVNSFKRPKTAVLDLI